MKTTLFPVPYYQNLFTKVRVDAPTYPGVPLERERDTAERTGGFHVQALARFGNAQIGPIYLGFLGVAALIFFVIGFTSIGWNMLVQVNYSPIEFVKQLFWLSVDPPSAKYGLRLPPMNEGGWWLFSGFFITVSILLWWARVYRRARALGLGTHIAWGFAAAI